MARVDALRSQLEILQTARTRSTVSITIPILAMALLAVVVGIRMAWNRCIRATDRLAKLDDLISAERDLLDLP
jgi:hypothetical protein